MSLLSLLLTLFLLQRNDAGCPESCRCQLLEANCNAKGLTSIPPCRDCDDILFLDLSHNDITELSDVSFKDYPKLKRLFLNYNEIHSIYDLKEKEIEKNNFTQFDPNSVRFSSSITYLSLRDNPLAIFSPLLSSVSLTTLELSSCKLKSLPNDTFALLSELEYILLENNELTELPYNIFQPLSKLKKVYLQGNPWGCGGYLKHLMESNPDLIGDLEKIDCSSLDRETNVRFIDKQPSTSIHTYKTRTPFTSSVGQGLIEASSSAAAYLSSTVITREQSFTDENIADQSAVVVYIYGAVFGIILITFVVVVVFVLRPIIMDCFFKLRLRTSTVDLRGPVLDAVGCSRRSSLEPIYESIVELSSI